MAIHALLYASRARVSGPEGTAAVAEIVRVSRERNASLGVTGALIYSGSHFAQFLEGRREAVEELMHSIRRDPRHTDVTVIDEGPEREARFANWSLAYSGPATFVDGIIARTLNEGSGPGSRNGAPLLRLLEEFSCAGPASRGPG